MVSRRTKEKMRDIVKILKNSWKMFSESITGLIGLGIILFFVVIAILAPFLNLRDPMHWVAPYCDILTGVESETETAAFENTLVGYPSSVPTVGEMIYKAYIFTTDGQKGMIYCIGIENKSVMWKQTLDGVPVRNVVYAYLVWYGKSERSNITIIAGVNTPQGGKLYIFLDHFRYKTEINCIVYPEGNQYLDRIAGISFPEKIISTTQSTTFNALWYPFFVVSEKGKIYELTMMIKPKGLGQTVRDLEIILEPGFTPGNEYVIPGNITVTGEPLQLNGQKFLVVTHDKGITFLRYNYSLVYPGPLPKNWVFSVFGNYSFNPSPKTAPITSKFYMDYGGYNNRTPIVAAGTDGKLYLFRLDAQEISKPQKYEVGTSTEEIASIAVTYEEEFQVYAGSENGKIKAYFYNRTWMNLTLYWEKDLGGKLVEPFAYSKVPTDRLYLVIEKEGTREMWVLGLLESAGTKAGDLRYKFETPKNISRPFPTGQKMQFTVRKYYDPGSGETKYENDTGEIVLLCDRNTYGILFVAEKVRTPLAPGTYPSGNTYWLGTDTQGRDILSRLVWGSQIALFIGVTAAVLSMLLGTVIGLVSGYYGGSVDLVLMRITDVFLVIPFLPLVIILAAVLGSSIMNIIYVLVLIGWPGIARVIRSVILSLKERPFIDAARVTGASHFRIMFKHLFPNVVPLAVLYMTFTVSGAILTEAALSFIGLGDPNSVSWGMILHDAQYSNAVGNWWMTIPAGLCITLVSMGFYLVGRAVEQIINPRLRSR